MIPKSRIFLGINILIILVMSIALISCSNTATELVPGTDIDSDISIMVKPDKPPKPDDGDMFPHENQITISGTSDADEIVVGEDPYIGEDYPTSYNYTVNSYEGNDIINLRLVTGVENRIDSDDDDDVVLDSPFNDTISLGAGNDIAFMSSGMGYVSGEAGNDTIKVLMVPFLDPPDPPYDPGGPFWLNVVGGSNKRKEGPDFDTLELHMSVAQIGEYATTIVDEFEIWIALTSPATPSLELAEVTAAMSKPISILINTDIENLRIVEVIDNQETLLYDHHAGINLL